MRWWMKGWMNKWINEHSCNHLIPTTHGGTPLIATVYQDTREEGCSSKEKKA